MATALEPNGAGAALVLDLTRPEDMTFLRNALKKGWDIPEKYLQEGPGILWKVATESEDERARVAALKTLESMRNSNLKALQIALDASGVGGKTVNIQNNLMPSITYVVKDAKP